MPWIKDPDKDAENRARHKLPLAAGEPVLEGVRSHCPGRTRIQMGTAGRQSAAQAGW